MDYEQILALAVVITGLISFGGRLYRVYGASWRWGAPFFLRIPLTSFVSTVADYARSFFPLLLLAFLFRSFLFEPYKVPTGSLEPTLLVGDHIVVNKFAYGLRLPIWHTKLLSTGEPKRGEIVVFRYPIDPSICFIKRVVGLPGDRIKYHDKVLTINGVSIVQTSIQLLKQEGNKENPSPFVWLKKENLMGISHYIYQDSNKPAEDFSVIIPSGQYFVMGDNRDASLDSRYWGCVPEKNLIGKSIRIFFSWDKENWSVRWNRLGQRII